MKNKIIIIIIFILLIISIIFNIFLIILNINYKKQYDDPPYGYYINKDLKITSIDVREHNAVFMSFFEGKHTSNETSKLLTYLKWKNDVNFENKYKQVIVIYENVEYDIRNDGVLNNLQEKIENYNGNYNIKIESSEKTGLVTAIILNEVK